MDSGSRIADLCARHHREAADLTRRRGRTAGALRNIFINLAVFEWTGKAGTPVFKQISVLVQDRMKKLALARVG